MAAQQPQRRRHDPSDADITKDDPSAYQETAAEASRTLLQAVEEFMLRNELPVTGDNLKIICDALSGQDRRLYEALTKREMSGEPLDQPWINALVPPPGEISKRDRDRIDQMEDMMDLMENTMSQFQSTTRNAREATGAYSSAVNQQLQNPQSETSAQAPQEVQTLLDLSRAMLGQLKSIEEEMERSQEEASTLRESLAKAREEADRDHLTNLPNRRAFERYLAEQSALAQEKGWPLSIAFADIDHFKAVNDTHGHEAGDRIIQTISKALTEIASNGCFVARHGGEEFVLLFTKTTKEQAYKLLDSARLKLSRRRLMNKQSGQSFGRITFSAGIAQCEQGVDPRATLGLADEALYQAKEGGRNRIELARTSAPAQHGH